ncbi:hypothetical protein BGZ83_001363, partial [Gryganskiella cystojenkinii]
MMRTQCFFNRTNGTVVEYNPTDAHWKSVRTEMQEQQRRNRYRTDYDGTVPMVDGLQGFGYCGHYLDIEALLEAQIFCLRALLQQSKKNIWSTNAATMTVIGRQDAQQQPVERKWRQPWPELEQILFTYRIGRGCSKEVPIPKLHCYSVDEMGTSMNINTVASLNHHLSPLDITEVLTHVFSFLGQSSLKWSAAPVCRHWYHVARRWAHYHLRLDPTNPKTWEYFDSRIFAANTVSIGRTFEREKQAQDMDGTNERQWNALMTLLDWIISSSKTTNHMNTVAVSTGTLWHRQVQIEVLTLNLESWIDQDRSLTSFNPVSLRELFLDVPYRAGPEIRIVEDSFNVDEARQRFWKNLALYCPQLHTLHFNTDRRYNPHRPTVEEYFYPIGLFPNVQSWGISISVMASLEFTRIWKELRVHTIENRMTSFTLLGDGQFPSPEPSGSAQTRERLLREFLFSSPLLLHLDMGLTSVSVDLLWDPDEVSSSSKATTTTLWACRGLRTLSMKMVWDRYHGKNPWTASVFGYLGRACPRLEALTLTIGCQVWQVHKGFCLLTRLRNLRRLELRTFGVNSSDREPFEKADFAWIQGYTDHSGSKSGRGTSPIDEQTYCLNKIQTSVIREHNTDRIFYDPLAVEEDRIRMRRQQEENQYRCDYDRTVPMVDGLEDLEISGGSSSTSPYLDIEA